MASQTHTDLASPDDLRRMTVRDPRRLIHTNLELLDVADRLIDIADSLPASETQEKLSAEIRRIMDAGNQINRTVRAAD